MDDERFRALASGELEAAADSLDPAAADMVRVIWFDLADKPDVSTRRGRLLVVIHHLVVDGVSWRILVTDLASVTAQLQAGVTPELPQIGTSYRRWAHGLVEHVGDRSVELDMWITILDGDDPLIGSRPLDPTIDVDDTVDHRYSGHLAFGDQEPSHHGSCGIPRRRERRTCHRLLRWPRSGGDDAAVWIPWPP